MRDFEKETQNRLSFIKDIVKNSGAKGIVFANSGGKDCTLVGILCKMACENTLAVMLPCESKQNYTSDIEDAKAFTSQFNIENTLVDITNIRKEMLNSLEGFELNHQALINIAPRLRMTVIYAIAASRGMLVAGTSNKSEIYMGYFTKWGDGAYDFNPIADLTANEVIEYLRYLKAPINIIEKQPSAGLYEGQTDEKDMGISYKALDSFLLGGEISKSDKEIVDRYHNISHHKRRQPLRYGEDN